MVMRGILRKYDYAEIQRLHAEGLRPRAIRRATRASLTTIMRVIPLDLSVDRAHFYTRKALTIHMLRSQAKQRAFEEAQAALSRPVDCPVRRAEIEASNVAFEHALQRRRAASARGEHR